MVRGGAYGDNGAAPVAIATEALSAAHELARSHADERIRQAGVNVDVRARFDQVDLKIDGVRLELAEMRGEARGQAKSAKAATAWLALAVAAIELLSHLPWGRILGHV